MIQVPEVALSCLAVAAGVAAGACFAVRAVGAYRWVGFVSAFVITVAVAWVSLGVSDTAPWLGASYAFTVGLSTLLISDAVERDRPALSGEPYWRRILLLAFHSRRLREIDAQAAADDQR